MPTIAAVLVAALTASLGQWQLRRADEKRALGQARELAFKSAPRLISSAELWTERPLAAQHEHRRIQLRGDFLMEQSIFIDNRTLNGQAGFHVVTPLQVEGSTVVVPVLRGWVARNERNVRVPPQLAAINQPVIIEGLVQTTLGKYFDMARVDYVLPEQMKPPGANERIWPQFDPIPFSQWEGWSALAAKQLKVSPWILRQTESDPKAKTNDGLIRDWPDFKDDVPKHQGYAAQWFALSATTIFLWVYFVLWRPRRKSKESVTR